MENVTQIVLKVWIGLNIIETKQKNINKKYKKFSKNYCKIAKSIIQWWWSGEKWYKVVENESEVKFNC